ncbi:MAG: methyltransferase, partial [Candidatus Micrarchaeaceae archaeon]
MNEIYKPDLDSVLLLELAEKVTFDKVLEIGIGSGFVLYHLVKREKKDGFGTDISEKAAYEASIRNATENVDIVITDCASCFRDSIFDLVVINPPYLRGDYESDRSIFGGKNGIEVAWRMISDGLRVLKRSGVMFF